MTRVGFSPKPGISETEVAALIAAHAAVSAAHHTPATSPKVKLETRAEAAASGDVSYTGYGFQPTGLIITAEGGSPDTFSIGSAEPALSEQAGSVGDVAQSVEGSKIVHCGDRDANYQAAVLKTFDADGFTLTWTKNGDPGAGTIPLHVFAFK